MESSHQLHLGRILRMLLSRLPRLAPIKTRSNAIKLEGRVASSEDMDVYSRDISISRRGAEKGPYYLTCADITRFIDPLYPPYVRGGADGKNIQVKFSSDKPSDPPPIVFSTYGEFIKYAEEDALGRVIDMSNVLIKYNGPNTDVPQTISIKRKSPSFLTTDYSLVVEASKAYSLGMIDVSLNFLFSGRAQLFPPNKYK